MSESFCTRLSSVVQVISETGFVGGNGRFVVGWPLTETGRLDTATGAAAGRQADESKKAEGKSKNANRFTKLFYTKLARTHHVGLKASFTFAFLIFTFTFMSFYPDKIAERLTRMRHAGVSAGANAVGTEANFSCGSFVRFKVLIDAENQYVTAANFSSNGCGHMLAAADVLAEAIVNKRLGDLHGLNTHELTALVRDQLGQTPTERRDCVEAAIRALRSAFADFRSRQIEEFQGEKALICTCFGVTEERIETIIEQNAITSVDQVSRHSNAGSGCGSCRMLIQEIIDSH